MRRLLPLLLVLSAQAALGAEELRLVLERKSLTATWRTYHQFIDGVEVIGTAVVERIDADGNVHEVARDVASVTPSGSEGPGGVGGASTQPDRAARPPRPLAPARGDTFVLVNINGEARPAWRTVVSERP